MKQIILALMLIGCAQSVYAQGTSFDSLTPPLPTAGERRAADVASWVTVGTVVALDLREAWRADDRAHQLQLAGARLFATWTLATLAKGLAQRERPDGSDRLSFYSMHTAMAFQTLGGPRLAVALPVSVGTGGLRVAVARSRYYEDRLREYLPDAEIVLIRDERDFFEQEDDGYDAMLHGAEFASPWTLLYPRYTVVVPQPDVVKGALSFALPRGEPDLAVLVDRWIDLKERDGTLRRLYDYWILGRDPEQRTQRWSVVRDVLHWVD